MQLQKTSSSSKLVKRSTRISQVGILFDDSLTPEQLEQATEYFEVVLPMAPEHSLRSYDDGLMIYREYCVRHGRKMVETDLRSLRKTLTGYLYWLVERGNRKSTISNRISTVVALMHICDLPNLFKTNKILKDLKRNIFKQLSGWQKQAEAVELELIDRVNEEFIVESARDLRDLAIINTMYDGLLRSNELQNVHLEHINTEKNTLFLPTSKGDKENVGTEREIFSTSINLINEWCNEMEITSGPVFLPLHAKGKRLLIDKDKNLLPPLSGRHIQRIVKRIVQEVTGESIGFSSHSMRVGKARTLFKHGVSAESIALKGGWTSVDMVMKYCRNISLSDL